eukprot:Em0016g763a
MDLGHTRPADTLIAGWDRDKPAAFDITIISPPCALPYCSILMDPNARSWASPAFHWQWRHGNWGKEAYDTISRLASHLAIHQSSPKSSVVAEIYGRLNMALILSISRAILFNLTLTKLYS